MWFSSLQGKSMKFFFLIFLCALLHAEKTAEKAFSEIYERGRWNQDGFSKSGSQYWYTKKYIEFLQDFIQKHNIRTIVDVGCGDFQTLRYIDLRGIQYMGYDVVRFVIDRNNRLFATPSIIFIQADALEVDLPKADLLLCKDVLAHLPNSDIIQLAKQFYKFKHCLITNDIKINGIAMPKNHNINRGGHRPLELSKPPFNFKGESALIYSASAIQTKQIFHICTEN